VVAQLLKEAKLALCGYRGEQSLRFAATEESKACALRLHNYIESG